MVIIDNPKISVVVPIYGVEKYLDDCIKSIVGQTYTELEIILVDDKSIDDSGKICDKWAGRDRRIKVVHKTKNEGLNMARNSGWGVSTGEFIAFVDGDDMIDLKYIETLYTGLRSVNADVSAVGYRFFQHNEKPIPQQNRTYENKVLSRAGIIKHHATRQQYLPNFHGNLTTVHCKLYKRSIVEGVEWDKSNYSIGEDDFFSLMCYAVSSKVILLCTELYYYRVSPQSISRSKELSVKYNNKKIPIFTLVKNYKELSTELLGENFFDETQYRTYVLYLYYVDLLFVKNAWSEEEFDVFRTNMANDVNDMLKIKKYKIDRKLLEAIKQNGSITLLSNIVQEQRRELNRVYAEKDRISAELNIVYAEKDRISAELNIVYAEKDRISAELNVLKQELVSHLGIKRSTKLLAGNIKRKITGYRS
jgi:glycosyltransferase involved in cell wall biosynthesis